MNQEQTLKETLRKYAEANGIEPEQFIKYTLDTINKYSTITPSTTQETLITESGIEAKIANETDITPVNPTEQTDNAIVTIGHAELAEITGLSNKIITRYTNEGIPTRDIFEMWHLAAIHQSNVPQLKNRLYDQDVSLEDMAEILEIRKNLTHTYHEEYRAENDFRKRKIIGPSINILVKIYHTLDSNIDELKEVMQAIDEHQEYMANVDNPKRFLSSIYKFITVYTSEGNRDIATTIDILEKEEQQKRIREERRFDSSEEERIEERFKRNRELEYRHNEDLDE